MKNTLLLCFLVFSVRLSAQHYAIKQLGVEKGLSNNYVVSIAQDKRGFLWFATDEGLNKFDGTRFITYYKSETQNGHGITGNELNCLLDDPKDSILWIGTQRAGLNAYDYANDTFTFYHHNDSVSESIVTDDVTNITAAADGNLWVTTYWRGIDYLDKETGHFSHYNKETVPELVSDNVWAVADGGNGKLYIGHVHHGFSVLSLKNKRVKNFMHDPNDKNSLPGNEVRCVFKDANNNIWLGTNKGLALFNPESENFIRFNPADGHLSHYIFDIRQFDEKLWIAMEFGGIAIMDLTQRLFLLPEQTQFHYIKEGDDGYGLSNSSVRCIFQDSFKNVWAGVWGGGINFLSNEQQLFSGYYYSSDQNSVSRLNNKIASSVCIDNQSRLWIGTDGGGINLFDKGRRVAVYQEEYGDLSGNSVQASLCDSEGNLWFGLFMDGVNHYDTKKKAFSRSFLKEIQHIDVRSFYEDDQHMLWIATSSGIYKVDIAGKRIVSHHDFENNLIRDIIKDSQGRLWVGTFGSGLGVGDDSLKNIHIFNTSNHFPSNTINAIYEDSRKNIWIGTGEGLVRFASSSNWEYIVYRREEGLANTHIRAITEDYKGNIWVSTNKGISCLLVDKEVFYNFDHWANVPMGNFMSGSVAHDANGNIYFGSINGLCYFDPEFVLAKREAPAAIITEMKIFGRLGNTGSNEEIVAFNEQSKVKLSYVQNSFNITFNVQDYALSSQVEYAYMLKGLEDAWYTVTDPNSVTFRNIPPGDYHFQVKTRIRNQEWSDEITSLDIYIVPPLWLTWWAKTFYVLFGIFILVFILAAYKKRLDMEVLYDLEKKKHEHEQELNNERLRFYTNITHELRTPLTLILGPLEDMRKSNSLSHKDAQKVSVIHQSAVRLVNLINQLLEFRKTETQNKKLCVSYDNMAHLVYETGLKYKELNSKPGVEIHIKVEKEDVLLYFDKEVVTIILDNLISNAIKYTEKGSITLELYNKMQDNINYTEIKISDTGYGINPGSLPHIFDRYYQERSEYQASGTGIGLALVKNLVTLHEGEITVESTLNVGTTFYFSLVTDNIYPHALHADASEKPSEELVENEETPESSFTEKPILLVVEDNQDICNYIVESFSDDFDVKTAANGGQGMEQALNCIPDIIVSDIMMPVMSGTEMCRKLKEDVRTSHIPVILLTAKDSLQDKEEGYQVGADSYLTKPFSATLLHSRINNLLESRRRLAERFNTNPGFNKEEKRALLAQSLNKLDNEFIEKINQLIEARLSSEKIDIGYLADNMYMSKSTLYRKMKALTGISSNEYVRKIKMQYAERLLLEGRYNVSEVAFKVGMNSVVYFRQCFKDEFGILPSEYLKQL
ncbi:two-component regulator propeller domain-containing protein [Bacteroides sp. 51]|uniref:hybrid sensor histidine kinase/response regulator transcription factor n=1 Tax=Bacteroides sp. 51 TaxID=2302938 RepID=UPI0013D1127E|nr:two-component regulator propeller domain-containing protein [Bacteroides sp. 51]NDV80624.1 response regulator [Bacteroides sp. 51]